MNYWNLKRVSLAIICVALHVGILVNVWTCNKLTPRVINIQTDVFCPRAAPPKGVRT